MRRITALLICLLLSLSALSAESAYLRLALVQGQEHPHAKACEYFSRIVSRSTEGNVNIKLYTSASLGNASKTIEQLKFGGIQLALVDMHQLVTGIPGLSAIVSDMDTTDRQSAYTTFNENIDRITKLLEENDMTLLAAFYPKLNSIYSLRHNFNAMDDFHLRTIGIGEGSWIRSFLESKGIHTRVAEDKDIVIAMNNYYIDAALDPFIDFALSSRYPFANCITITESGTLPSLLIINTKVKNQLPEEAQAQLMTAAGRAAFYADTLLRRQEESWLSRAKGEKVLSLLEIKP